MQHVLLAPCSRRKRGTADGRLRASDLPRGPIDEVAAEWAQRLRSVRADASAGQYYAGRGPSEAKAAAAQAAASLVFVSAGLRFVRASELVPRYSLTTAPGDPDGVGQRVEGAFSPEAWWTTLRNAGVGHANELRDICSRAAGFLIVALPGTYLRMVGPELSALPPDLLARIRIVGAPRDAVPPSLSELWMPYDGQFDGAGALNPGTRGDFPQRAARHFFQSVLALKPNAEAAEHAAAVWRCFADLPRPARPSRRAGSDAELIAVISSLLPQTGGRSGQTLALLRREAGWACEQGRFRRLFAAAAARRLQA